jgi:hypothetical protein
MRIFSLMMVLLYMMSSCTAELFAQARFIRSFYTDRDTWSERIQSCMVKGDTSFILLASSVILAKEKPVYDLSVHALDGKGEVVFSRSFIRRADTLSYYGRQMRLVDYKGSQHIIICGYDRDYIPNVKQDEVGYFCLLDEEGNIFKTVFSNSFSEPNIRYYDAMIIDDQIIVTGSVDYSPAIFVYDIDCNYLKHFVYNKPSEQLNIHMMRLKSGDIILYGVNNSSSQVNNFVMRLGTDFQEKWHRNIVTTWGQYMLGPGVVELPDGNLFFTSSRINGALPKSRYVRVMNPTNGAMVWDKQITHDIVVTEFLLPPRLIEDKYIDVAGRSYLFNEDWDLYLPLSTLTRLDLSGKVVWERIYFIDNGRSHSFYRSHLTAAGNLIVGGVDAYYIKPGRALVGYVIRTDSLGCAILDCDSLGVSIEEDGLPDLSLGQMKLSPNPARDLVQVDYKLPPGTQRAKIELMDMQGKRVSGLPLPGYTDQGQVVWGLHSQQPGMYLMVLSDGDRVLSTEKLIIGQ